MSAHDDFAAALLDPQHPCPPDLTCWNGSAVEARFAVYRNNVFSSLVGALADSFPVVQQLVGEAFFGAMARVYVHRSPPRSPLLLHYGDDFPTFIEGFEPAGSLPYLADVARLERLRSRAYHAADSPSLDADAIARVLAAPDQLPGIRFQLHPSVAVLGSPYAVVSLWAAHQGVLEIARVDPYRAEQALIVRNALEVEVIGLPAGAAAFTDALLAGMTFAQATEQGLAVDPALDLGGHLALLIRTGAFTHSSSTIDRHSA